MRIGKGARIAALIISDVLAVNLSIWAALALDQIHVKVDVSDVFIACLIYVLTLHAFKAYMSLWDKAGIDEMLQIGLAVMCASILIRLYLFLTHGSFSFGTFAVSTTTLLLFSGGVRFSYRALRHLKNRTLPGLLKYGIRDVKRTLIIGAGDTCRMLLKDMAEGNTSDYVPVAIIDDDPNKQGMHLNGVKIVGNRDRIADVVKRLQIDTIIVATPSASPKDQSDILKVCSATGKKVRIIPGIIDILSGDVTAGKMRDVSLEDLLGRDQVRLDDAGIAKMINGSTVLVTGGAGSIGSELVRQCIRFSPRKIVVMDIAENRMYMLAHEIKRMKVDTQLVTLVGSVRDEVRLETIFNKHKPDLVFHAAAHKHVPLMEESPAEAIKNNIYGTYLVAKAAVRHEAKRFVFISTDKAVNPTSIMGASKRFSELVIGALEPKGKTKFASVRFGNVLGSDGSVVPIFTEQIKTGGPVTVTHEEITRYFMLISEAVQLVLQSAYMTEKNELFVLDMGTPVRIADMARDLIRLHGFEPDKDIKIEYTGLRTGEKMYEELFYDSASVRKTQHDKVYVTNKRLQMDWGYIESEMKLLMKYALEGRETEEADELMRFVKGNGHKYREEEGLHVASDSKIEQQSGPVAEEGRR